MESEVDEKVDVQLPTIRARVSNFEPLILLKNLKANYYGIYEIFVFFFLLIKSHGKPLIYIIDFQVFYL